jgi:hypothetical protein
MSLLLSLRLHLLLPSPLLLSLSLLLLLSLPLLLLLLLLLFLPLFVLAVILSAAKDPDTAKLTHTAQTLSATTPAVAFVCFPQNTPKTPAKTLVKPQNHLTNYKQRE